MAYYKRITIEWSYLGRVGEQTLINHYLYSTKSANTRLDRLEQSLAM